MKKFFLIINLLVAQVGISQMTVINTKDVVKTPTININGKEALKFDFSSSTYNIDFYNSINFFNTNKIEYNLNDNISVNYIGNNGSKNELFNIFYEGFKNMPTDDLFVALDDDSITDSNIFLEFKFMNGEKKVRIKYYLYESYFFTEKQIYSLFK